MAAKMVVSKINPNQYKKLSNFNIVYGSAETQFGNCLLGINDDRVCFLSFFDEEMENPSLVDLKKAFPNAILTANNQTASDYAAKLFEEGAVKNDVNVLMKGTEFETNVWEQLLNLQKGSTASYQDVAVALGKPNAIRAVARAVAKNNVSYLIPCHRVISKSKGLSKYRWGAERKLKMLKYEEAI